MPTNNQIPLPSPGAAVSCGDLRQQNRAGGFFKIGPMAKKNPKRKINRKPTSNRPKGTGQKYGEPTESITLRLPVSVISLLDALGPSRNAALVGIVKTSIQYRLEYGSGELEAEE